ncbi:phage integrase SAM-like domain-containing protein, partial [Bacteroides sp.]
MKKQVSLTRFMLALIGEQEAEQRFSTAHIYRATLNAFTTFVGGGEVYFGALNPATLKQF